MPSPDELPRIIDRAVQLAEEAIGQPVDRHKMAERVIAWYLAGWPR